MGRQMQVGYDDVTLSVDRTT